jgi:hypothetical protein
MMASTLQRLREMRGEELTFRARTAARTHAQRIASLVRRPQWDRRSIVAALSPAMRTGDITDAVEREDWTSVHDQLRHALTARPSRFVIEPQEAVSLRQAIVERFPDACEEAAANADAIVDGRYSLLGYPDLCFARDGAGIDWHFDPVHGRTMPRTFWADVRYLDPRYGDHKIVWELNRHQHWLGLGRALWLTGDRRYGDAVAAELQGWLAANPPLAGANWTSMLELGFRSLSWVAAAHFLLAGEPDGDRRRGPWLVDLLVGLDRQLRHVEQNLSRYFSPNTHLTGEALALYVAGAAFPELAASARWIDAGRGVLLSEISRQIGADGGHAERSTHYHRYTLDFYLLALITAERSGDIEATNAFRDTAERLAVFMKAMVNDHGRMPQIGDDDGGMLWPIAGRDPRDVRDSLSLAAVLLDRWDLAPWGITEEALWMTGTRDSGLGTWDSGHERHSTTGLTLQVFPDTGLVAVHNHERDHLVFDGGAHGYLNGGHAHADALSLTLSVGGEPLLIDPGTAAYTIHPELRDRLRSTAAHNTLVVDGRPSSSPSGPFHWQTRADAAIDAAHRNRRLVWLEASHAGFDGLRHRRHIVYTPWGGWLIADVLAGEGSHRATAHWHFAPDWTVSEQAPGHLRAAHPSGRVSWLLHDATTTRLVRGDAESRLGWCSPRYGALVPTWTAEVTREADAPVSMLTWIGGHGSERVALDRLNGLEPGACAARLERGNVSIVTAIGGTSARSERIEGWDTDARVAQYAIADERVLAVALADATHASVRGSLSVTSRAGRIRDLSIESHGERLDLWASQPPAIALQGSVLDGVRILRLNGRERLRADMGREAALTLEATDWGTEEPCAE